MKEIEIPNIDYKAEIKKCKTIDDVVGKNGLMQKLLKDVMQQLLEAEMEEHLGRERYERSSDTIDKNYRNGHSSKSIKSSYGEVGIDIPRDRNGDFNPQAIKKYQTDCNELDKKNNRFICPWNVYKRHPKRVRRIIWNRHISVYDI